MQQQIKIVPLFFKKADINSEADLKEIANGFSQIKDNYVFFVYSIKNKNLIYNFDGIDKYSYIYDFASRESLFKKAERDIFSSNELGLQFLYPNFFFAIKNIKINHEDFYIFLGSNNHAVKCFSDSLIKNTFYIDTLIIFMLFFLYILVTIFAVAPIFLFIRKFNRSHLSSNIFKVKEVFEFNHIKRLRVTLLHSLRKIEKFEVERLHMIDNLIKHQNDVENGKIVSQIIHDLKSPLAVFEEILNNRHIKNNIVNRKANLAFAKMNSLIESIRDPKKEKYLNKEKKMFDMSRLFSEIKCYAKTRNVKIIISPHFNIPEIYCDHLKIERCLQNLIRNAIYYCHSFCKVEWQIKNNSDLYIEVIDDGNGVSSEIENTIFEWRITGNKLEGTGVGLSYVKYVADIHGGEVSYFRRNNATVFYLYIPNILNFNQNSMSSKLVRNYNSIFDLKNEIFFLVENHLYINKIKHIKWPNNIKIVYLKSCDIEIDFSKCFCFYTDSSTDFIEKALTLGVSVVLHKQDYSSQIILKKVLQTKKMNGVK
ncbi:sensor histidine kinase [Silvanigrella aquatica]|uniref:sensor histidine kinase n=1 Tax=Silvanigrella aquatica TaxID=1915309 RepID=UPI001E63937D|nr:HAMP domain-containing sensor histidine kinase [Silvanigrella aquatica]